MAVRTFLDPDFEQQLLLQVSAYRQRFAALRAQADVGTGLAIAEYADTWPGMDGNTAVMLASAGVGPLEQAAVEMAQRQARASTISGPIGELVDPAAVTAQSQGRPALPSAPEPERGGFGSVLAAAGGAIMGGIRGIATTVQAPFEELSAGISSVGEALFDDEPGFLADAWGNYTEDRGSHLRMAVADTFAAMGDGVTLPEAARAAGAILAPGVGIGFAPGLGEGFLPGGQIGERREAAKQQLQLDGTFVTPGRLVARLVSDPGERAYGLISGAADLAANVFLDPVNYLVPGGAAAGRIASRTRRLAEAGNETAIALRRAVPGLTTLPERQAISTAAMAQGLRDLRTHALSGRSRAAVPGAVELITSTGWGRNLVDWLTVETSPTRIHELSRRNIPGDVAVRLADAATPDDVVEVLTDTLGSRIRNARAPRSQSMLRDTVIPTSRIPGIKRDLNGIRWMGIVPERKLTTEDPAGNADRLANFMRTAKVAEEQWRPLADEMMRIDPNDRFAEDLINGVTKKAMTVVNADLVTRGVPDALTRKITHLVTGTYSELRDYAGDDMARPFGHFGEDVDINGIPIPNPIVLSQVSRWTYSLPDPRELRRAASAFNRITTSTPWAVTSNIADGVMDNIWKPVRLLRGALTSRILGDNIGRQSFAGLDNIFNHPLSWIGWMVGGDQGRLASLAKKIGIEGKGGSAEVLSELDSFRAFIGEDGFALIGGGEKARGGLKWPAKSLSIDGYVPIRKGEPDYLVSWGRRLALMAADDQVRKFAELGRDGYARWLGSADGADVLADLNRTAFRRHPLDSPSAIRQHAADVEKWVMAQTRGNADLMDGLARGHVLDVKVAGESWDAAEVAKGLEGYLEYGPTLTSGDAELLANFDRTKGWWNRATDFGFSWLVSKPENALNRSPVFRQHFAQRYREVIAYADQPVYDEMLAFARDELNLDFSHVKRNGADAFDTFADAKLVAADFAAEQSKKLLYDTTRRAQFSDTFRIAFPFAEPWRDAMTTWGRIAVQNPTVLRKASLVVNATSGEEGGFFYENDHGESEFAMPVADWLFRAVGGGGATEVRAVGRTLGLNLIGSAVIPGVGPILSLPLSVILPEKPTWEWLSEQVFPAGEPSVDQGWFQALGAQLAPPYFSRLATALAGDPESDRIFGNRVQDVMRTLAATGEYTDEQGGIVGEDARRLVRDATSKARLLYLVSAAASWFSPTPTSFRFEADTPDGVLTFDALTRAYRDFQAEDPRTAFDEFVERFGIDLAPMVQARSYSTAIRSVEATGAAWEANHADLADLAPNTIGVFAPQYSEDEFAPAAFTRQFVEDQRHALGPGDALWLYNNTVGQAAYRKVQTEMGEYASTEEGRGLLATFKETLRERYPGYDATEAVRRNIPAAAQIAEVVTAMQASETLRNTPAGRGISQWLALRDAARDASFASEGSVTAWEQSGQPAMVALRWQLRQAAEGIIRRYPDFAVAYDRIFEREMQADDPAGPPPRRRAMIPAWARQ